MVVYMVLSTNSISVAIHEISAMSKKDASSATGLAAARMMDLLTLSSLDSNYNELPYLKSRGRKG